MSIDNFKIESLCKLTWRTNSEIRDEFGTLDVYTAYEKAFAAGQIKILGGSNHG